MQHIIFKDRIALRVDVDYTHLCPNAVDRMMHLLEKTGSTATFFIANNSSERNVLGKSLFTPSYIQRLFRLKAWRLLPRAFARKQHPRNLATRVIAAGHEVAVHGYRHRWWMDHILDASEKDIQSEIDLAYASMQHVPTSSTFAWGSPGWRTTPAAIHLLSQRPVPYFAECWGTEPFFTAYGNTVNNDTPHLPITRPSLETLLLVERMPMGKAIHTIFNRPNDRYDLCVVHDYFEGDLRYDAFSCLLTRCAEQGIQFCSLREMAEAIIESDIQLPTCHLEQGEIPGFTGKVAVQGRPQ